MIAYLHALKLLVFRELHERIQGTVAGWLWLLLEPAFLLLVYTFVFGFLFKIRFNTGSGTLDFALYLVAGLLPFNAFRDSLERGAVSLSTNRDMVQRVVFPPLFLPAIPAFGSLLTELIGLLVLQVAVWIIRGEFSAWTLLLPLVIGVRLAVSLALAWAVAILSPFFKDLTHLLAMLLTLLFFATPIIYPPQLVPVEWQWVYLVNPFHYLIAAYRAVMIDGAPPPHGFWVLALVSPLLLWGSARFFNRAIDRVRDVL